MFSKVSVSFLIIVVFIGALLGFYKNGYSTGFNKAEKACSQQTIEQLSNLLKKSEQLTERANEASKHLSEQVLARQLADSESTREIKNALNKSAHQRVQCVFDADSLQRITAAYERAAAATSGGIGGTVPDASNTGK